MDENLRKSGVVAEQLFILKRLLTLAIVNRVFVKAKRKDRAP